MYAKCVYFFVAHIAYFLCREEEKSGDEVTPPIFCTWALNVGQKCS